MAFRDRSDAGRVLAARLSGYANRSDVAILALRRGGVPVAFEVAKALDAPLDVFVVRKLGVPGHEELAMGAIASGAIRVLNEEVSALRISEAVIARIARIEQAELERRERSYRGNQPAIDVRGRIVIVVDDASPPAPACARPSPHCVRCSRSAPWSRCRRVRPRPAANSLPKSTKLFAQPRPSRSTASASGNSVGASGVLNRFAVLDRRRSLFGARPCSGGSHRSPISMTSE